MKAASKLSYYNLLTITLIAHVNMTLYKYIENVLEYKLSNCICAKCNNNVSRKLIPYLLFNLVSNILIMTLRF